MDCLVYLLAGRGNRATETLLPQTMVESGFAGLAFQRQKRFEHIFSSLCHLWFGKYFVGRRIFRIEASFNINIPL